MQMSDGVEWAAHCCSLLAMLPDDVTLPASHLAEYHGIPSAYLAKQLQALAGAGILHSSPGRSGGYSLARPAAEITLLDVVLAIEGPAYAFSCTEIRKRGPSAVSPANYTPLCGVAAQFLAAEDAYRDRLRQATIADLVANAMTNAPPEAIEKGTTWVIETISRRATRNPTPTEDQ